MTDDFPELTKSELTERVRFILTFHKGRDHRISRWQLVENIFGREAAANRSNNNLFDRRIRDVISECRDIDLIVSSSSLDGYWLATDMNDIEVIAAEYVSRAREMEERARNLRQRGGEMFGPQMNLFKAN